jgi:hypothetical protein
MNESQPTHTGGCLCGAVRYTISGAPAMAGHCHCLDCRKSSGAGHVTLAMFDAGAYAIEGKVAKYTSPSDSGSSITRSFCPTCGSRLFGQTSGFPDMLAVNVGTLDDPEAIQPQFRVFAKRHLSWDAMDPALPAFFEMPPMDNG